MPQYNFLQSVARYYGAGVAGRPAMDEPVYVLPNKRSAMFLKKYVRECATRVSLMPRFMTMRTFLSLHARYSEADSREQIFILYEAYRRVMNRLGREQGIRQFDSFVFWGDMILSDFNDIDCSLANADELFKNLRDVKDIQADYLDEDQKEVIRRVWGESRLTSADADAFWLHVNDGDDAALGLRFVYLWEILADVYHEFNSMLAERELSSTGGQYKQALATICALSADTVEPDTHYVFVGFNDLTTVETLIFEKLQNLGVASFFWDTAPLSLLKHGTGDAMPVPLRRLKNLVKAFPMPEGYKVPEPSAGPGIKVMAVPSNVGQAKAIHDILGGWLPELDVHNALNTAVVLPDQGLLMPALLAVPEDIDAVNISMGLAYRTTTFASLFHSIISMQLRSRELHGRIHYYYEDVMAVLAHPHIRRLAPEAAEELSKAITEGRMYNIPADDVCSRAEEFRPVFAAVRSLSSADDVADYLATLFYWLAEKLRDRMPASQTFELDALRYFSAEVDSLRSLIARYAVTMSERTFLHLFERIFSSRGLTVNGSPLAGLQMLGVLETRALDFDNVIILSMNERIFPRAQYSKTMIPVALRAAFGLPDFDSLEWTYAYCFYRLVARARRVTLLYDSRPEGQGNGEMSRYISQLRYLMPGLNVKIASLSYVSRSSERRTLSIKKSDDVLEALSRYRAGGSQRLSASALKTYKSCPVQIYLKYVRNMRGSDDLVDYMSASQFGTAVHDTIQSLYEPYKGSIIDRALIDSWLDPSNKLIEETAHAMVIRQRYGKDADPYAVNMSVDADINCRLVSTMTRNNLKEERDFYCRNSQDFTFIGCEYPVNGVWHLADGLDVNFYMSIDRVDGIDAGHLRFVDFKTGKDDIRAADVAALFTNGDKDGMFQLFTYAQAYRDMVDGKAEITPVLHSMRRFAAGEALAHLSINKQSVYKYSAYEDDFKRRLIEFVGEIFNPAVEFGQCADIAKCTYCQFKTLCGRIIRKN